MSSNKISEYFIVIGSPLDRLIPLSSNEQFILTTNPLKMLYTPQILDQYPLDIQLPSGLVLFCLPGGMNITTKSKPATFFSFVQTSDTGSHLIGSCFTFYEQLNSYQRECLNTLIDQSHDVDISSTALSKMKFYLPRCLCLLSQYPFVTSFKKFLCHIYQLSLTPSYIPLERYICNFIDEIPSPPLGKVEISYFIGTENVIFKHPEPPNSSTISIQPLFECLSFSNIIHIFVALLCERQVVLISSQYSLLTATCEALLSFLYPLKWTHVYIPILPRYILGVLAAPLPFLIGIHSSFLPDVDLHSSLKQHIFSPSSPSRDSCSRNSIGDNSQFRNSTISPEGNSIFSPETIKVYLDTDVIEFGSFGLPPSLPESKYKKLISELSKYTSSIEDRRVDWSYNVLPYYDLAFPMSLRPDAIEESTSDSIEFDSKGIHSLFLDLLIYLLQDYRKYLIFPSHLDPTPIQKFRTTDYLNDHPSECTPILNQIFHSQAFYQFIDASVTNSGWTDPDIIYFDESIENYLNRSSFNPFTKVDIPSLEDFQNHTKTYVVPSPIETLDDLSTDDPLVLATQSVTKDKTGKYIFRYVNFPKLNPKLYRKRQKSLILLNDSSQNKYFSPLRAFGKLKRSLSSPQKLPGPNPDACIYSIYLIIFSRILSSEFTVPIIKHNPPSLAQIMSRLHISRPLSISSHSETLQQEKFSDLYDPSNHLDNDKNSQKKYNNKNKNNNNNNNNNYNDSNNNNHNNSNSNKEENHQVDNIESLLGDIELIQILNNALDVDKIETNQETENYIKTEEDHLANHKSKGFVNYHDNITEEAILIANAVIEILFEIFEHMQTKNLQIDEEVYRSLAEACAVCSATNRIIFLLEVMISNGILPDIQICIAVARALYFSSGDISDDMADTGVSSHRSDTPLLLPITPKEVSEAVLSKDIKKLRSFARHKQSNMSFDHSIDFPLSSPSLSSSSSSLSLLSSNNNNNQNNNNNNNNNNNPLFKCNTQLSFANRILDVLYPDLKIDLNHPNGTTCPNIHCNKGLNFQEIVQNFTSNVNKYTVNCKYCNVEFVPRFTVHSSISTWCGNEGPGTLLWCELLSPWTLQKEILNIMLSHGISYLLSNQFRSYLDTNVQHESNHNINVIIFWNLIVYFRYYNLPYAFLVTNNLNKAILII